MAKLRVSIKPTVYNGLSGYKIRWVDGKRKKSRALFAISFGVAKWIKLRLKDGKTPTTAKMWAVKIS